MPLPSNYFFDWLTCHQEFDFKLPMISERGYFQFDTTTGLMSELKQSPQTHEGSFSTKIKITIRDNWMEFSGNPSRFNRLDNLFGLSDLDACFDVYNQIARNLGLPSFTKCTGFYPRQGEDGKTVETITDGAEITRLDITQNMAVGQGNEPEYLRALSTMRYRNSLPHLYPNGNSVSWESRKGNKRLIAPKFYGKAHEMRIHDLDKCRRKYGPDSDEFKYISRVIEFCQTVGLVRCEQGLKSEYLKRYNLRYWGLMNMEKLEQVHSELINLDEKLQVTAMTLENIAEKLLRLEIVETTKAANTTAMYALQWMGGAPMDLSKRQVQLHRGRLRKIGIDIAQPVDITRQSPVFVRKAKEIVVQDVAAPTWYQPAGSPALRLVA